MPIETICMIIWQTDKHLWMVMSIVNSDVKTDFLAFDLDIWPKPLTYNPSLAKVKVNHHAKYQGTRSNGSVVRVLKGRTLEWQTDKKSGAKHEK